MKRKYFGTDGVRGPVGGALINPDFVRRLAFATGSALRPGGAATPFAFVGRDTRASGEALVAAVGEGLLAAGWNVRVIGIVPTPAVAMAVKETDAALGVVITASHNPAADNGVKFFRPGGMKLVDATELRIEELIPESGWSADAVAGCTVSDSSAGKIYFDRIQALLPAGALKGWKIVVDCANGATCSTTPAVLRALGATVIAVGCEPDGGNINAGVGSEHPELLATQVLQHSARLGIAHDGDGDRVVVCDEKGVPLDGDEVLTFLACHALRQGTLDGGKLIVTIQSNLGVDAAVSAAGGRVVRTDVGDRYVIAGMVREGASLGGESSGHLIFPRISPTGDGLVAALEIIRVMLATGQPLSELRLALVRFPQASEAIRVKKKRPLAGCVAINAAIAAADASLGSNGRVLVRYSGTEPKIRLLVEGRAEAAVSHWITVLRAAVAADLEIVED